METGEIEHRTCSTIITFLYITGSSIFFQYRYIRRKTQNGWRTCDYCWTKQAKTLKRLFRRRIPGMLKNSSVVCTQDGLGENLPAPPRTPGGILFDPSNLTFTLLEASRGKPFMMTPTSVVVPPMSTTMAFFFPERKAAPRILLVGPEANVRAG